MDSRDHPITHFIFSYGKRDDFHKVTRPVTNKPKSIGVIRKNMFMVYNREKKNLLDVLRICLPKGQHSETVSQVRSDLNVSSPGLTS